MKRVPSLALVSALLVVAACATSYRPDEGKGGYSEAAVAEASYRVQFRGNRSTSKERAHELMLRRCAELAVADGYDGFVIVESTAGKAAREVTLAERYQQITGTKIEHTNECRSNDLPDGEMKVEAQTATVKVPLATATIRLFRGDPPQGAGEAYLAQEIVGAAVTS
jgi:hypothetical protein